MQNDNELYHYGRLGMRWGMHRFHDKYGSLNTAGTVKKKQLEDEHDKLSNINTLTKKGIQRKADVEKQYAHLTGKTISSHTAEPKLEPRQKSMNEMTNEELTAYNNRKQLETAYQNFQPKPAISKGKQFMQTVATKVLEPVAIDLGKQYLKKVAVDTLKSRASESTVKKTAKEAEKLVKEVEKAASK